VRVSGLDELGEGEWGDAGLLTAEHGNGVREELARPAAEEMPVVAGAGLFGVVALGELAEDGFNAPSGVDEPGRPAWALRVLAARGRKQIDTAGGEFGL
jgi:hypothetical protein